MADKMQAGNTQNPTTSLELLYHISRELASDLDLQTVLRRVLRMSLEAVGGNSGSIIVLDQGGAQVTSIIIHSGRVFTQTSKQLSDVLERGLAGWVVSHKEAVILDDTSQDPRWIKRPDDAPEQTGAKSAMSTPLLARDEMVGVMTLVHPSPGTFNEAQGNLMQAIADMAGIAILNARLFEESRNRARAMTALAESAMAITASLGTEDILKRVLSQIQSALNVEAVCLSLVDHGQRTLSVRAAAGQVSDAIFSVQLPVGEGLAGEVAARGRALVVPDLADQPRVAEGTAAFFGFPARSAVSVPIRAQDEVLGVLQAFSPLEGSFNEEDEVVLSGIGSLAGSVIRYGQLFQQLEAAHRRYRELFDDSIDIILITDLSGAVKQFNRQASEAMHLSRATRRPYSIFDLHQPEPPLTPDSLLEKAARQDTVTYESEISTPEGDKAVQVYVRKIQLDEEERLQWILHDVSEHKRIETLRDDLISTIYHDLRTPLANVMYSLDMIENKAPGPDEELHQLLGVAERAVDRIQRLTASLLDIRALQAGQPLKNLTDTQASALLDSACHAILPLAEVKRQTITVLSPEDGVFIHADADMLGRVLINLLENAVKYTPEKGRIEIGARRDSREIRFWVEDDGPGIPDHLKETIFDKYTRLDSGGMGFGLGLSFCRLALEAHQGRIWVENGSDNGARFMLALPLPEPQLIQDEPLSS